MVEILVEYPATDFKVWSALNMKHFLTRVYPKLIPPQYLNDPVLSEHICPLTQLPIRNPCLSTKDDSDRVYETATIIANLQSQKKALASGEKTKSPINEYIELVLKDLKYPSNNTTVRQISDRIELRLLLLDAHQLGKTTSPELGEGKDSDDDLKDVYKVDKDWDYEAFGD